MSNSWFPGQWIIPTGLATILFAACATVSEPQLLLEEQTAVVERLTEILSSIETVADARGAQPELARLQEQGLDIQRRMVEVTGQEIHWSAKGGVRRAFSDNEAANRNMRWVASRLQRDPQIWRVLGQTLGPR